MRTCSGTAAVYTPRALAIGWPCVPKPVMDRPDVVSVLEQVHGEGMAERVTGGVLGDPVLLAVALTTRWVWADRRLGRDRRENRTHGEWRVRRTPHRPESWKSCPCSTPWDPLPRSSGQMAYRQKLPRQPWPVKRLCLKTPQDSLRSCRIGWTYLSLRSLCGDQDVRGGRQAASPRERANVQMDIGPLRSSGAAACVCRQAYRLRPDPTQEVEAVDSVASVGVTTSESEHPSCSAPR